MNDLDPDNVEDLMDEDETTFQPEPTKISTRREMHPDEETTTEALNQLDALLEGLDLDDDGECDDDECDDDDTDDIDEGCGAKEECSATESAIDQLLSIV